eukprot:TRINITY_DN41209_c0_g1_i1.p1 TRINITY_DN41209_c0_g1~~TRINITY_DN41209_c0_g1_i1.p1  ORF type:complete len:138 (+),score=7.33 TRINITY_DN41209_c0_g1_i1:185-598(+)
MRNFLPAVEQLLSITYLHKACSDLLSRGADIICRASCVQGAGALQSLHDARTKYETSMNVSQQMGWIDMEAKSHEGIAKAAIAIAFIYSEGRHRNADWARMWRAVATLERTLAQNCIEKRAPHNPTPTHCRACCSLQ